MKSRLPRLEDLKTTRQALFSGELSLENFQNELEEHRQETLFQIGKTIPNPMAGIPVTNKLIILVDIVGFSKSSTVEQFDNIYLFQRYLKSQVLSNRIGVLTKKINIHGYISTGDGCYIVADECECETALDFLVMLVGGMKEVQKRNGEYMSLRASALIGPCVPFIDIARHINFVGEGMNEASRILNYGQQTLMAKYLKDNPEKTEMDAKMFSRNSIYLGDSLIQNINDYVEDCNQMIYFKDVADKHNRKRNVTVLQGIWEK